MLTRTINYLHLLDGLVRLSPFRKLEHPGGYLRSLVGSRGQVTYVQTKTGAIFPVRSGTTDASIINEVVLRDQYRLHRTTLGPGSIIDAGANIGIFSVLAARMFPDRQVIAVEPVTDNVAVLRDALDQNHLEQRVTVAPFALAAQQGHQKIYRDAGNEGGHSMLVSRTSRSAKFVHAPTLALRDLFEQQHVERCALLKMDIEGAEYEVLRGCTPEVLGRIDRIHLEFHRSDARGDDGQALAVLLRQNGFEVEKASHPLKGVGYLFCERRSSRLATSGT